MILPTLAVDGSSNSILTSLISLHYDLSCEGLVFLFLSGVLEALHLSC